MTSKLSAKLSPGLYLVAVPIGDVQDITLRAKNTLNEADLVLCEDTRVTSLLFAELGIKTKLISYHEHNAEQMRPRIEREITEGAAIALVTDAGTPLVSDPGYKLVIGLREKELPVTALPGPCAAINALVLSGLPPDRFFFAGFLPNKSQARKKKMRELVEIPGTLIFYESPNRIEEMIEDAFEVFGDRTASIVREMTKKHEQVLIANLEQLSSLIEETKLRGEIVVLIGAPVDEELSDEALIEMLTEAMKTSSKKEAVKSTSEKTGISKNRIYQLSLEI